MTIPNKDFLQREADVPMLHHKLCRHFGIRSLLLWCLLRDIQYSAHRNTKLLRFDLHIPCIGDATSTSLLQSIRSPSFLFYHCLYNGSGQVYCALRSIDGPHYVSPCAGIQSELSGNAGNFARREHQTKAQQGMVL